MKVLLVNGSPHREGNTFIALSEVAETLRMLGDEAEWTYWLAMSALADIRNGTTDQASMWELAQHMYTTGDYARANRYICRGDMRSDNGKGPFLFNIVIETRKHNA